MGVDGSRLTKETVHEGRLTVIDVGDNGYISNVVAFHRGRALSTKAGKAQEFSRIRVGVYARPEV